jgi:hypothetical protein
VSNAVPASIVVAGGLIAAGLFFGLRASRPELPAPTPERPSVQETPVGPSPVSPAVHPPRSTTPAVDVDATAIAAATAAVEAAHAAWTASCWDTADTTTLKAGSYVAVLGFGANGKAIVAGVTEIREGSDFDVARCLRTLVPAITIPAPGKPVSVEIPFEIP